jgi:hypothetical protein
MEKVNEFMAFFITDLVDKNHEVQESNESEAWKLGYQEATDAALKLAAEIFEGLKK